MATNDRAMVEAAKVWADNRWGVQERSNYLNWDVIDAAAFTLEQIALAVAAERTRIGDEMENIVGGVGSSTAADTFHELNDYIEKLRAERATDDSDPVGR